MGLLSSYVLPGSGMFGKSARAWHCAYPEPFLRFWMRWQWDRPAACGPQLAFPRKSGSCMLVVLPALSRAGRSISSASCSAS